VNNASPPTPLPSAFPAFRMIISFRTAPAFHAQHFKIVGYALMPTPASDASINNITQSKINAYPVTKYKDSMDATPAHPPAQDQSALNASLTTSFSMVNAISALNSPDARPARILRKEPEPAPLASTITTTSKTQSANYAKPFKD
jgi:hypothetical protein